MLPNSYNIVEKGSMTDFENYNREYDADDFACYSEARKFNLEAVKTWLAVRDMLTHEDDVNAQGVWRTLLIVDCPSKYGLKCIYIDIENKKWRTMPNVGEWYGGNPKKFDLKEFEERMG